MPPIYFHVGVEKTGSTAVQREFSRVRDRLLQDGLFYPGPGLKHPFVRYVGQYLAGGRLDGEQRRDALTHFNRMSDQWKQMDTTSLLLSEETVSRLRPTEIAGTRKAIEMLSSEIFCLVYVRHPLSHVISIAAQKLKGRTRTIRDLEARVPIYPIRERLTNLIDVFGRDHTIVRGYDPTLLSQKSIQHDVLDAVGYAGDRSFIKGLRVNEALSLPAAMILSATTERNPPRQGERNRVAHRRRVEELSKIPGPRFTLSRQAFRQTRDMTASDLAWLKAEFGIELPEPVVLPREEVANDFTEEDAMAASLRMFPSF